MEIAPNWKVSDSKSMDIALVLSLSKQHVSIHFRKKHNTTKSKKKNVIDTLKHDPMGNKIENSRRDQDSQLRRDSKMLMQNT